MLLGEYVDDFIPVKLSDFGLSRSVYARDYYKIKSKSLLPVRWMPPEAITYTRFTSASDVYSFGVVIWEIFSYGIQPYDQIPNEEVVNHILEPIRLRCPVGCPDSMYAIMQKCWRYHATDRPGPKDLIGDLQAENATHMNPIMSPGTMHRAQYLSTYINMYAIQLQQHHGNTGTTRFGPPQMNGGGGGGGGGPPRFFQPRGPEIHVQ